MGELNSPYFLEDRFDSKDKSHSPQKMSPKAIRIDGRLLQGGCPPVLAAEDSRFEQRIKDPFASVTSSCLRSSHDKFSRKLSQGISPGAGPGLENA